MQEAHVQWSIKLIAHYSTYLHGQMPRNIAIGIMVYSQAAVAESQKKKNLQLAHASAFHLLLPFPSSVHCRPNCKKMHKQSANNACNRPPNYTSSTPKSQLQHPAGPENNSTVPATEGSTGTLARLAKRDGGKYFSVPDQTQMLPREEACVMQSNHTQ